MQLLSNSQSIRKKFNRHVKKEDSALHPPVSPVRAAHFACSHRSPRGNPWVRVARKRANKNKTDAVVG